MREKGIKQKFVTEITLFRLCAKPGKLEKTVMEGVWSSLTELSWTSEDMAKISEVGLNLTELTDVVKLRTIFSGFGRVEFINSERLEKRQWHFYNQLQDFRYFAIIVLRLNDT